MKLGVSLVCALLTVALCDSGHIGRIVRYSKSMIVNGL